MLKRLYNSWHIADPGERSADKLITSLDGEIIHIIHHLRISSFYHRTQLAGEIDFLVLTRLGLMVIEVKGGEIGYGERTDGTTGYFKLAGGRTKEAMADPFIQADGNADAIQKYLMEKGLRNIFVGKMVCFPDCDFVRKGISIDYLWHRGCGMDLSSMILRSLDDQIGKFREDRRRLGRARAIDWKELEEGEIIRLCEELTPRFDPDLYRSLVKLNLAESDRRRREGLAILKGLDGNRCIMIQGPPGSGKSTYAVDLIRRLTCDEGKTGLYICWNELLAEEMKQKLSDPELEISPERIKVKLYFELACELGEKSGDKSLIPSNEVIKKGELRQCVKGAVSKAGRRTDMERCDFVIVDEAQDIFDKGIDLMLKALLKGNNPIENGSWFIFYDDSQDYPDGKGLSLYIRTRDMFRNNAASYMLTSSLRVNTGHGIDEFVQDAASGSIDPGKDYGKDVAISGWKDAVEAIRMVKTALVREKSLGGTESENCIVLFTADLLRERSEIRALLEQDEGFELLTPENYSVKSARIRYTTMLKAKGLERDVVVLVSSPLTDRRNQFQVFIGASRARGKVVLLIHQ
jgi:DNA polymerase III delta prime subunit